MQQRLIHPINHQITHSLKLVLKQNLNSLSRSNKYHRHSLPLNHPRVTSITHSSAVSHYNKPSHSPSSLMKLHPHPSSHSFSTHPMYLGTNSSNPPSRHSNPTIHRSRTHSHKVRIKAWTSMNLLNRLSANSRCSLVLLFTRQ